MVTPSITYLLQHPDGTEVTAQEFYDAFMSGPVILSYDGQAETVELMEWFDVNGEADDPTNVICVSIQSYSKSLTIGSGPL